MGLLRLSWRPLDPKNLKKTMVFQVFEDAAFWLFGALDGPLGLILPPSWADLVPKWVQNRPQKLSKKSPKTGPKNTPQITQKVRILGPKIYWPRRAFGVLFGVIFKILSTGMVFGEQEAIFCRQAWCFVDMLKTRGPRRPRQAEDGPRQVQDGSSHAKHGPRQAQNSLRQAQDVPRQVQD